MAFKTFVHQMPILAPGKTRVTALVTIKNESTENIGAASKKAAILIGDVSGSMEHLMGELKRAGEAWVNTLEDGTKFAFLIFSSGVKQVYPRWVPTSDPRSRNSEDRTVAATAATRAEAIAAIRGIPNGGDTIMDLPIAETTAIFSSLRGYMCHCLFLTDGDNRGDEGRLRTAVKDAQGVYQCDVRILGGDSNVKRMRESIATPLLGQVKVITDARAMAAEFSATLSDAMGKSAGDVTLAIHCPFKTTGIESVTETVPNKITLPGKLDPRDAEGRTWLFRTTPWNAGEERDYLVVVQVTPLPNLPADKQQAMINTLTADGRELPEAAKPSVRWLDAGVAQESPGPNIVIAWSNDEEKSRMYVAQNRDSVMRLAFATNQTDLVEARQALAEAARKGDIDDVTRAAKRVISAAEKTGDADLVKDEATRVAKVGVKVTDDRDADGTRKVIVKRVDKLAADDFDGGTTQTKKFVQRKS